MRKCGGMDRVDGTRLAEWSPSREGLGTLRGFPSRKPLDGTRVGCATGPVSAPELTLGKRIIEIDLLVNEQRVRFNEAIRAITLREPLAVD